MATHIWSVLCRRSIVDQEDDTMSLIEIVEGFKTKEEIPEDAYKKGPAQIMNGAEALRMVSFWGRDDRNKGELAKGRLRLLGPAGKALIQQEFDIDLREHQRSRNVLRFPALLFSGPGTYMYTIQMMSVGKSKVAKWITVAKVPLDVNIDGVKKPSRKKKP